MVMFELPPEGRPATFHFWDGLEYDWAQLFAGVGRSSQRITVGTGTNVVNAKGDSILRRYRDVMNGDPADPIKALQNLTELKLGGVVNLALNQRNEMGFVWNFRPVVPFALAAEYRNAWRAAEYVPGAPDADDKEAAFLATVRPLIGQWSLETPRGYGSVSSHSIDATSKVRAEGKLLVTVQSQQRLGMLHEDMAQNPAPNDYYVVRMDVQGKPVDPNDVYQRIAAKAIWLTRREFDQAVRDGHVTDPYSLAMLEMCRIYAPDVYLTIA